MADTAPNLLALLQRQDSVLAQKSLDFLDGKSEPWMVRFMNDPEKGRKDWKQRGLVPRSRNLTRMIVEKSGLLFSQNAPRIALYKPDATQPDLPSSNTLLNLFEEFDWLEFFNNFDEVVRLMKTALVLVQWDPAGEKLVMGILTQANSYVQCNPLTGEVQALVVKLAGDTNEPSFNTETGAVIAPTGDVYFRIFTNEQITDYVVTAKGGEQLVISQLTNPFGIIPIAVFHDTLTPRADCFWNQGPHDLIAIHEMYALHISDSEYAAQYSKLQTLVVTDAEISQDGMDTPVLAQLYGQGLPRYVAGQAGVVVGPGSVMSIKSNGQQPHVQYMGPNPDLAKIDDMFNGWIADYAGDWSVNVKTGGGKTGTSGNAAKTSGFQLIIEELPNIQLRQRRQKMMAAGFGRLFDVLKTVVNTVKPNTFSDDLDLFIEFTHPRLEIDPLDETNTWILRITNNQASIVDYFMEVKGMGRSDAIAKAKEVLAVNGGNLDYDPNTNPLEAVEFDASGRVPEEQPITVGEHL